MAERVVVDSPSEDRVVDQGALHALVIVALKLGIQITPEHIQREQASGRIVKTLEDLARVSLSFGIRSSLLNVSADAIVSLDQALPVIIEMTSGSIWVLQEVSRKNGVTVVSIVDASSEKGTLLVVDLNSFLDAYSGRLLMVKRNYDVPPDFLPFGLRMISKFITNERRVVRDVAISAFSLSLLALMPILFWRLLTDRVLPYHAFSTFYVLCGAMIVLIAFEASFAWLRRLLILGITTRLDIRLSTLVFRRVLSLPMAYFETTQTGFILHRFNELAKIRNFLLSQLFGSVLDAGVLVVFVPVMFFFSPLLTCVVLGLCLAIVSVIVVSMPALRRLSGKVVEAETIRGAFLAQTIHGVKTVKSLALDRRQMHQWDVLTARAAGRRIDQGNFVNLIQTIVMPLERCVVSGSLALGVFFAMQTQDPVAVGSLLAFLMLSQRIAGPLIQASQLIHQYDEARIAVDVVAEIVNQLPEEGRDGTGVRKELAGYVEFSGVTFQYKGALRPALRGLTFEVPKGTTLGVMGRSGSGKTTITRLLQRLHSDYTGLIKIDGIDVRQYDVDHLRASLGVVLQENFLFSGTLRENITIAKPDATYDDMVAAARLAGAEEFIDKLPAGYETFIYEGSPNLSGGQRQRIAIARALITDPKILILDEATSALDAESEAIVNANIGRIAQGRTVITISHRLSALVKADAIMVLDGGVIDDIGRHEELLERNDIYAGLWYTQNQHAGPAPAKPSRPKLAYSGPSA